MKIKTSELIGPALDWAVAKCLGIRTYTAHYEHTMTGVCVLDAELVDMNTDGLQELRFSRDWNQGGPIIEREAICICTQLTRYDWMATSFHGETDGFGDTPLIAAMRCYVASKLGDEVDVPEELV